MGQKVAAKCYFNVIFALNTNMNLCLCPFGSLYLNKYIKISELLKKWHFVPIETLSHLATRNIKRGQKVKKSFLFN